MKIGYVFLQIIFECLFAFPMQRKKNMLFIALSKGIQSCIQSCHLNFCDREEACLISQFISKAISSTFVKRSNTIIHAKETSKGKSRSMYVNVLL